jgi:hypothetical protein
MFLARSKNPDLFEKAKFLKKNKKHKFKSYKIKTPSELQDTEIEGEVSYHRPIKIGLFKNLKLFLMTQFSCLSRCCISEHSRLLKKLKTVGLNRI